MTLVRAVAVVVLLMSSTALAAPTWKPDGDDVATTLTIGGEPIDVTLGPVSRERLPRAVVEAWLDRATRAVTTFYGHFPQKHVRLHIFVYDGMGIGGTTYGGRRVELRLGNETPAEALNNDWTLTHEALHTAFPNLDENHLWMQEGMATYFEPLARARIGDYTDERLWAICSVACRRGCLRAATTASTRRRPGDHLLGRRAVLVSRRHRHPRADRESPFCR